jgi:Tfp pilus assembly protein PilV
MFALVITAIGVLALMSIMPQGWASSRSSDERSRATMIMRGEMARVQVLLSNKCNSAPAGEYTKDVNSKGLEPASEGDSFTVNKSFQNAGVMSTGEPIWWVTVQVLWPGTTAGVRETHQVIQRDEYVFPLRANTTNECSQTFIVSYR